MIREAPKSETPDQVRPKNTLAVLISVIVVAAVAYMVLSLRAGFDDVVRAVRDIGVAGLLVGVIATSLASYSLGFLRWQKYLKLLGYRVPACENLKIFLGSFALAMTPARSGEILRGLFLRNYGVPFPVSFAAFVAERIIDLLAMSLLVAIGLWSYTPARPLILLVGLGISAVVVILNLPSILQTLRSAALKLPLRFRSLAVGMVDTALNFRSLFGFKGSSYGLAMGVCIVALEGFGLYMLLQSLGADIGFFRSLAIYGFSLLAGALSFLPGGMGGFEAAMLLLLTSSGLNEAQSVAVTLLIRLGTLWLAVLVGMGVLTSLAKNNPTPV